MYGDEGYQVVEQKRGYEVAARYRYIGEKLGSVMRAFLTSTICGTIMVLLSASAGVIDSSGSAFLFLLIAFGLAIAVIGFSIYYCVCVIQLGRYYDSFKTAGILYIVSSVVGSIDERISDPALLLVLMLFGVVLSLVQTKFFVDGMTSCLNGVDPSLQDTWSLYWKAFVISMVVSAACAVGIVASQSVSLALFSVVAMAVIDLAMAIWELILIKRSSDALIYYSYTIEQ